MKPDRKMTDAEAQRFAEVAMAADATLRAAIIFLHQTYPADEDAIVSGAITAVVRFGIERQQDTAARDVRSGMIGRTVTERDVFGYFIRYVQQAATILLSKPARPQA